MNDPYIIVYDWMTKKLGLKGLKRDIFAIIYGFNINYKHYFYGTHNYLASRLDTTIQGVGAILKKLEEDNFIITRVRNNNCVKRYHYCCNFDKINELIEDDSQKIVNEKLTILDSDEEKIVNKMLTIVNEKLTTDEEKVNKMLTIVNKMLTNNKYNIKNDNNIINNNINKTNLSDLLYVTKTNFENNDSPRENKNNTQLEGDAEVTVTKNKLLLNKKDEVSISNLISEKMSNINNEEARENQVKKAMLIEEKRVKQTEGKKKGRMKQLNQISREVMNNEEIQELLETYLSDFEQMTGGFPGNASWRKRLENLKELAENDNSKIIELINLAITKGWKDFYKPQKFDNHKVGRPSFDTMSNYEHVKGVSEMTEDERAEFLSEDNLSSEEF